ncbi:MAG: DEAD/DEAH box helicase [Limnohabitans sp.]|nr:DEAD/DEAH box helicase [Limnohabitans sp.]
MFAIDFSFNETIKYFIPQLVWLDEKGEYLEKIVSIEILKDLETKNKVSQEIKLIFQITQELQIKYLEKKFVKKAKNTLEKVLQEKEIAKVFNTFVQLKTDHLLRLILQNKLELSTHLKGKDFYNYKIDTTVDELETVLHFQKHSKGITYTLQLKENDNIIIPRENNIIIVCNGLNWVIVNKRLYKLKDINANKITPFLTKESIEIPNHLVKDYFDKFIKEIIKKSEIQEDGFEVIKQEELTKTSLLLTQSIYSDQFYIDLEFEYKDVSFFYSNPKKQKQNQLDIENTDDIKIIQYHRNATLEQEKVSFLNSLGLVNNDNYLLTASQNNTQDTLEIIIKNQQTLEENGFDCTKITYKDKKIQFQNATLLHQQTTNIDWFDIKITVQCGTFSFPFTQLINNIKNNNPFYLLPDDTWFVIPSSWMKTYAPLAKLGKIKDDSLTIQKNNFGILEKIPELAITTYVTNEENSSIPFDSNAVKATLRGYQIQGVQWLLEHHQNQLGACLADDMGLGKTLQTLAVLATVKNTFEERTVETQYDLFSSAVTIEKEPLKAIIVLPNSLLFNWQEEARKFTPQLSQILYFGKERKNNAKKLVEFDLIFTTYGVINKDIEILKKYDFRYIILDESQQIKNKESKIFKAINEITALYKISLSGTPIENSLSDLWSQMQFINPNILGSFSFFKEHYLNPIQKDQNEEILAELKQLIDPFILRRTKEQVLKDLPELTEQIVYCTMTDEQEKAYEEEKSKARNELLGIATDSLSQLNVINTLMRLRQWCNHPKLINTEFDFNSGKFEEVCFQLETLIKSNQKVLVFSSFVKHLELFQNWSKENKINHYLLRGSTPTTERKQIIENFQNHNGSCLFFISLKAGGVGLNLTQASYVLLLDPWWNPFAESQAIARAHRMGQKQPVNVLRFITKNTIEEKIILLQEQKKLLSDQIIEIEKVPSDIQNNLEFVLA